jgi:Zn-finger protein
MKKRHVEACLHPILRWWICPLTSLTAFQHNHGWMHVRGGKETHSCDENLLIYNNKQNKIHAFFLHILQVSRKQWMLADTPW